MSHLVFPSTVSRNLGAPATKMLSINGDETGGFEMANDYSVTPTEFFFVCPGNEAYIWQNINVFYTDIGAFALDSFGSGVTLTNGIELKYLNPALEEISDLQGACIVKTNGDWNILAGTELLERASGATPEGLSVRWSFGNHSGGCYCTAGYRMSVTLNDDFSGLETFKIALQGKRVT